MSDRIGRRRFLETAGRMGAGAVLGSIPLLDGCKGNPTAPEPPPPLPQVPVTLEFTVYNHTKGLKGSFVRENVMSESLLEISVSELVTRFGITDVDDKSIIIKKLNLGFTAAKSFTGTAGLKVPRENTVYDIFLLNIDGQQLYAANEASSPPRRLRWNRSMDVLRNDYDGKTGEERIWGGEFIPEIGENGVIDQYNKALNPDGIPYRYGDINRKPLPHNGSGDFGYGFGECSGREWSIYIPSSAFPLQWAGINPTIANNVQLQVGAGIEAVLWMLMLSNLNYIGLNMGIIHDGATLNQKGKDFIAYLYLRDWS